MLHGVTHQNTVFILQDEIYNNDTGQMMLRAVCGLQARVCRDVK